MDQIMDAIRTVILDQLNEHAPAKSATDDALADVAEEVIVALGMDLHTDVRVGGELRDALVGELRERAG